MKRLLLLAFSALACGGGHGGPMFSKPAVSELTQKFFDKYLKGMNVKLELVPESELTAK
jgi:hypothetical protein